MSSSAKNLSTTTQPLLINDGDADGHRSTPKYKSSKRYLSSRHMSGKLATIKKSDDLEDMERRKQCSGYDFEPYEEVLTAEQRADLMSDSMLSGDDSDADDIRSKDPEAPSNPDEDMYRKLDTKEKTPLVKRVLHEIAAILW